VPKEKQDLNLKINGVRQKKKDIKGKELQYN